MLRNNSFGTCNGDLPNKALNLRTERRSNHYRRKVSLDSVKSVEKVFVVIFLCQQLKMNTTKVLLNSRFIFLKQKMRKTPESRKNGGNFVFRESRRTYFFQRRVHNCCCCCYLRSSNNFARFF